jgi:hypothetical protein
VRRPSRAAQLTKSLVTNSSDNIPLPLYETAAPRTKDERNPQLS